MPFAAALRQSLHDRQSKLPAEFRRGDSLEDVLNRHLRTVERTGGVDVVTCILLLSPDGKRLSVGAAPTLPASYCRVGDSFEVGLSHGSCAAAAYFGRPIYSADIETDPIWADFGEVALRHGYRSCWSTPIRNSERAIIGTFAALHRTTGMPTRDEIEAIDLIASHVAEAIMWSRSSQVAARSASSGPSLLKLVSSQESLGQAARLIALAQKLRSKAADLDRYADSSQSEVGAQNLRKAAELSRKLAANVLLQVELARSGKRRR
ncbi:MAG: GAF domain-containing protein [Sphingomicrobium sp.]